MSKKKPTIVDVANMLGVATSTVSRALKDHPTISQKTKQLVLKTVKEMDYTPNNIAASLRKGKGNSIGVIIPKINSSFMSNCIFGIESITYPSGYNLIICQSNENYEKEKENVRTLINSQVSGVLLSLSNETVNTNHLKAVINNNIPLVMFDRVDEFLGVDCVVNEDIQASQDIIKHLVDKGYKKIAILNGPTHIYVYKNRLEGYIKGVDAYNLEKRNEWIIKNVKTRNEAFEATKKLFKNTRCPDAIFCTSDTMALGALLAIKELGLNIPKEVGIAGYSNDIYSEITNPSLTTVEQFPQEIGSNAAKIMLDLIEQDNIRQIRKTISIKPNLIIRQSTEK